FLPRHNLPPPTSEREKHGLRDSNLDPICAADPRLDRFVPGAPDLLCRPKLCRAPAGNGWRRARAAVFLHQVRACAGTARRRRTLPAEDLEPALRDRDGGRDLEAGTP